MLRRIALLIALALPLSGCVTYEVVERRVYHSDGSYTRIYDPQDDGRRYEYDADGRRYEYDRYEGGYGYDDDPYELWFYGWRGPGTVLYVDPWYDRGHWFSHRPYSRSGWRSAWSWGWSSHGGWGSSWSGHWGASRPWFGGYSPSWNHGYGYGYGYTPQRPHRPHRPRPQQPQVDEPIARPKPSVRAPGGVVGSPRLDGAALRPGTPTRPRWDEPDHRQAQPQQEPIARPKPRPGLVDAPPRFATPREEPRFEPREAPRFEPREAPRFEPREEPRFEPREAPRFEPREEPRFEPREESPIPEDDE